MSAAVVDTWVGKIRPHLHNAATSIIEAGRLLNDAKAELPHGGFGPLLAELGLGEDMARRFMRVARHPVLANRAPVHGLPPAVSVLDVLARMDADDLADAIDRGEVNAGTTRAEAERLVRPEPDPMSGEEAERLTVEIRAGQLSIADLFADALHDVPAGDRARHLEWIEHEVLLPMYREELDPPDPVLTPEFLADSIMALIDVRLLGIELDPARPFGDQLEDVAR